MPNKKSKRKTSERKSSVKRTWERCSKQNDFRTLLKDVWKSKNPQKEYSDKITKLHKKYSNTE